MAYVKDKQNDVFISYAHLDNARGWVEDFAKDLNDELKIALAEPHRVRDLTVFWDQKMAGNMEFTPEILEVVRESAVMVLLVSDNYLQSAWCNDERKEFPKDLHKELLTRGRLDHRRLKHLQPIFRVEIAPVKQQLPEVLSKVNPYDFCKTVSGDKRITSPRGDSVYDESIKTLASEIVNYLKAVEEKRQEKYQSEERLFAQYHIPPVSPGIPQRPLIFINRELGDQELTKQVKACLKRRSFGFVVEPRMNADTIDYQIRLRTSLKMCKGAIIIFQKCESRWVDSQQEIIAGLADEMKLPQLHVNLLNVPPGKRDDLEVEYYPVIEASGDTFDCTMLDNFLDEVDKRAQVRI